MRALHIVTRAAASIFTGDPYSGIVSDEENNAARDLLRLALKMSDRTPMNSRQYSGPAEKSLLEQEDAGAFWTETPAIQPKPETIEKALAAVEPPAAGVE